MWRSCWSTTSGSPPSGSRTRGSRRGAPRRCQAEPGLQARGRRQHALWREGPWLQGGHRAVPGARAQELPGPRTAARSGVHDVHVRSGHELCAAPHELAGEERGRRAQLGVQGPQVGVRRAAPLPELRPFEHVGTSRCTAARPPAARLGDYDEEEPERSRL